MMQELVVDKRNVHSTMVHSVGFSPDGTRIVSGSGDSSVKVWGVLSLAICCCVLVVG